MKQFFQFLVILKFLAALTLSSREVLAQEVLSSGEPSAAIAPSDEDHEQLRALLKSATVALNNKDIGALRPFFDEKFVFTTVDQRVFTDLDGLKAYFDSLTQGSSAPVRDIAFNPTATNLTEIVNDIGISYGTSVDKYTFRDGDVREMTSSWSAVLRKVDGQWKVMSVHIGVNPMENPIITSLKGALTKAGVVGGAAGALAGLVVGFFLFRKKSAYRA